MNKWKWIGTSLALVATLGATSVSAASERQILLNYKNTGLSASQMIAEGTTLVPLKAFATEMGYALSWDPSTKTVTLVRPEREIKMTSGISTLWVNGEKAILTQPPRILHNVMYVPLVPAVNALGGKIGLDAQNNILNMVDEPRFTVASILNRTYWVSQKNGDVYYRPSVSQTPTRIGGFQLINSAYTHQLEIKDAGNGSDLLLLSDHHYAMFNDFNNGYQAWITEGQIRQQMDYHFITPSYTQAPQLPSTQLYMTDGKIVQYLSTDGSLGQSYALGSLTDQTGDFTVEYAAADILLVRSVNTTQLYAISTTTRDSTNLSEALITAEDWKEWQSVDGKDPYVLTRMLVLTNRSGPLMTFKYTPLQDEKAKTVTFTLKSQ